MKKALRPAVAGIVLLAVGYFFYGALSSNWEALDGLDLSIGVLSVLSYLSFVSAIVVSGLLWKLTFETVTGKKTTTLSAVVSHLEAWLLKYIPGQVGALVSKVRWAQAQGVSKAGGSLAFAFDILLLTIASTVITIPIVIFGYNGSVATWLIPTYLAALVMLYLASRDEAAIFFTKLASKVTKTELSPKGLLNTKQIASLSISYLSSRFLNGLAFVLLCESIVDIDSSDYIYLGSAFVVAGIVGIWAILVPSGLGVREGVLVALTAPILGLEVAISIALIARLYTTLSDLAVAVLYLPGKWRLTR